MFKYTRATRSPKFLSSKEWSGTKEELTKKKEKMESAIKQIIAWHREMDKTEANKAVIDQEAQYAATLKEEINKIKTWLHDNDDKLGKTGKPRKSNVTDNESAKMKTSKGVIQGYDGVAMVVKRGGEIYDICVK